MPGYTTLDKMVTSIRAEANAQLYAMVVTRMDLAAKARLARLLSSVRPRVCGQVPVGLMVLRRRGSCPEVVRG